MIILAIVSLFAWIPIVTFIFGVLPSQRTVVVSFIFAWLFLPGLSWDLPGLPDYTKMSATIVGVLLSVAIFDLPRLMTIRFRWFDLPMLIHCLSPFFTSLSVGLGAYDGISAVLEESIRWGFPYLIGRVYFTDLAGVRQLAIGIAVGGLIYTPLCLIEIRMSPRFATWVYGMIHWEPMRYGGYRPKVFLSSGLECGMWMTCAVLVAQRLWASGAVKTIRGYSFGMLTLVMFVTTVLCKLTGALMLLAMGLGVLWAVTRTKSAWPVWLLIAVVPFYTGTRISGLWSGREVLDVVKVLGEDRAQSLEFRMENEDILIAHALKNPYLGGGRTHGAQARFADGRASICDGYWIITFGHFGLVGLTSLVVMMLQPAALLIRRHPVATWARPDVAPAAALAILLVLVMIDEVSNGMLNPIYAVIMGGLTGLAPAARRGRLAEAEASLRTAIEMADEGHWLESEVAFRRAIELSSGDGAGPDDLRVRAEALEGLGSALESAGHAGEAEEAFREAVADREALAMGSPDADHYRDLALGLGRLGRALARSGRVGEAIRERRRALDLWNLLADSVPDDPDLRGHRANALNDLAWLLAAESDPSLLDPPEAVRLAEQAVRLDPGLQAGWNTLGVARYRGGLGRRGRGPGAIGGREPAGGTAFDHFFLAMAFQRLGDRGRARDSLGRAVNWSDRHRPGHPDLTRFRDEAVALLGRPRRDEVDIR